jgi:ABC-type glycerol-3-phosphate transport system substrate-binding protein
MKKVTFILALGVALTLTACGSGSAATETTDSTVAPVADTTAVVADPAASPVEGGVVKEEAVKPVSDEAVK